MTFAIVLSRAQVDVEAPAVAVETHLANGLPSLTLVGLLEGAVKESKDRAAQCDPQLSAGIPFAGHHVEPGPCRFAQRRRRFDLAVALGLWAAREAGHTLIVPAVNA